MPHHKQWGITTISHNKSSHSYFPHEETTIRPHITYYVVHDFVILQPNSRCFCHKKTKTIVAERRVFA